MKAERGKLSKNLKQFLYNLAVLMAGLTRLISSHQLPKISLEPVMLNTAGGVISKGKDVIFFFLNSL